MDDLFFKDWESFYRVIITTPIAFLVLFLFLRVSGKRTMAKLNAFDFVVTVALGSTLAYMMLSMVPLAGGTAVLFLLIVLQYAFAWLARVSKGAEKTINSVPRLLYYEGEFIQAGLSREAVTKEEILASIRGSGAEYVEDIRAVVMEINGSLTVVKKSGGSGKSSLEGIEK